MRTITLYTFLLILCACANNSNETANNLPKPTMEDNLKVGDYIFVAKEDSTKKETVAVIENPMLDTSYTVLDSKIGDINLDAYPDKIVILKSKSEGIATNVPRPLLLFVGQPDKSFKLQARN